MEKPDPPRLRFSARWMLGAVTYLAVLLSLLAIAAKQAPDKLPSLIGCAVIMFIAGLIVVAKRPP